MSNVFKAVAQKFQDSALALPVSLACMLGVIISLFLFAADYRSSLEGYKQLPTMKVEEAQWAVALSLQVGQIIFFGLYTLTVEQIGQTRTKANVINLVIAFFLLICDLGTDMWFKTAQFTTPFIVWVIAFFESVTFYTIGSEMLFIGSLGLLVYVLPAAKKQLEFVFQELTGKDTGQSKGRM